MPSAIDCAWMANGKGRAASIGKQMIARWQPALPALRAAAAAAWTSLGRVNSCARPIPTSRIFPQGNLSHECRRQVSDSLALNSPACCTARIMRSSRGLEGKCVGREPAKLSLTKRTNASVCSAGGGAGTARNETRADERDNLLAVLFMLVMGVRLSQRSARVNSRERPRQLGQPL